MQLESLVEELRASGWNVVLSPERREAPAHVFGRYPSLPPAILDFLMAFDICVNPDQTAWLLSGPDFLGTSDSVWHWNAFELMSLEFAGDDAAERKEVAAYWDKHFPILLSVKTGYSYFAVSLEEGDFGSIVHGFEPLFEESALAAPDMTAFLADLVQAARGRLDSGSLNAAV